MQPPSDLGVVQPLSDTLALQFVIKFSRHVSHAFVTPDFHDPTQPRGDVHAVQSNNWLLCLQHWESEYSTGYQHIVVPCATNINRNQAINLLRFVVTYATLGRCKEYHTLWQ